MATGQSGDSVGVEPPFYSGLWSKIVSLNFEAANSALIGNRGNQRPRAKTAFFWNLPLEIHSQQQLDMEYGSQATCACHSSTILQRKVYANLLPL